MGKNLQSDNVAGKVNTLNVHREILAPRIIEFVGLLLSSCRYGGSSLPRCARATTARAGISKDAYFNLHSKKSFFDKDIGSTSSDKFHMQLCPFQMWPKSCPYPKESIALFDSLSLVSSITSTL